MKTIALVLALSLSASASVYFNAEDLAHAPDLNLVCGFNHSNGDNQLLVYIKDGVLVDYRGNVDFKNVDSGVGMLEGQVAGFAAGQFILSKDFKSMKEGTTHVSLSGCATSVEDYYDGKFIDSL